MGAIVKVSGIVGMVILGLSSGCASVKYTSKDGDTFTYRRLGIQKIQGFDMKKDKDGLIKIAFDNQEGSTGDITETLKNISEVLVKGAGTVK